jgi:SAM-dependent methyltransferase
MAPLDRSFGRRAFGEDPANYDTSRPDYPDAVWQALRERAGLRADIDILEIGAGTGIATRHLLKYHPARLVAVEPDPRLAAYLADRYPSLDVIAEPFETVAPKEASFDLVACATAFHWLDSVPALQRIAALLKPNGHVALWWNVYGDPNRADPFHEATAHLFGTPKVVKQAEFALDTAARLADFTVAGFVADPPELLPWTLHLDAEGVRRLYATYSNVNFQPPEARARLLDGLAEIAATEFGGHVERNIVTAIYTARPDPARVP